MKGFAKAAKMAGQKNLSDVRDIMIKYPGIRAKEIAMLIRMSNGTILEHMATVRSEWLAEHRRDAKERRPYSLPDSPK